MIAANILAQYEIDEVQIRVFAKAGLAYMVKDLLEGIADTKTWRGRIAIFWYDRVRRAALRRRTSILRALARQLRRMGF